MFVTPSWAAVDHQADDDADLFLLSDRPVLEALGLARTELASTEEASTEEASTEEASTEEAPHAAGEL
jgi:gentisate 1,2-dioxygenase